MQNWKKSGKIENLKIKSSGPKTIFMALETQKSAWNPGYQYFLSACWGSNRKKKNLFSYADLFIAIWARLM